jgi:hypothetical protein
MKMRVAHDQQKRSSLRWMGCKKRHESLDDDPRKQYWVSSKLNEEVEDVMDDEEDMYFEFEQSSALSTLEVKNSFKIILALLVPLLNIFNLT